ncbi:MAG: bis(5'-nucleosyl)-tetraphosphatase (symmetrical) YqeK [Acholeplasma sp.]|nr:bis(5'-nucleosyl)-tetraphosphatase (symmetrical) YqeK [Acholeplasma sp.]
MTSERAYQIAKDKFRDNPQRFKHTLGVCETAVCLANKYNLDVEKMKVAALFHDYSKYDSIDLQTKYLDDVTIEHFKDTPVMFHALAASQVLKNEFNYEDTDVLNAINKHVWGASQMSLFDKVLLISDKIEPNRSYDKVDYFRKLAFENIDLAVIEFLKENVEYNKRKGFNIPSEQIKVIDDLEKKHYDPNKQGEF